MRKKINGRVERVWYDVSSGQIFIQTGEFVSGIALARIPEEKAQWG